MDKSTRQYKKRVRELGSWAADRGYDAWDIFIHDEKWTRLMAITDNPWGVMLRLNPCANIDWDEVTTVKLT